MKIKNTLNYKKSNLKIYYFELNIKIFLKLKHKKIIQIWLKTKNLFEIYKNIIDLIINLKQNEI